MKIIIARVFIALAVLAAGTAWSRQAIVLENDVVYVAWKSPTDRSENSDSATSISIR